MFSCCYTQLPSPPAPPPAALGRRASAPVPAQKRVSVLELPPPSMIATSAPIPIPMSRSASAPSFTSRFAPPSPVLVAKKVSEVVHQDEVDVFFAPTSRSPLVSQSGLGPVVGLLPEDNSGIESEPDFAPSTPERVATMAHQCASPVLVSTPSYPSPLVSQTGLGRVVGMLPMDDLEGESEPDFAPSTPEPYLFEPNPLDDDEIDSGPARVLSLHGSVKTDQQPVGGSIFQAMCQSNVIPT